MGFQDMVNKAKADMKAGFDGEFLLKDQVGKMMIHAFTFYETDKGKWGAIKAEIVEASPRVSGAFVQKPGTMIKQVFKCHGDYPKIGYEGITRAIQAIFDPEDDAEFNQALTATFGSHETGFTNKATAEDRKHPFFGARGVIVGFTTKVGKSAEKRIKNGKEPIVDVYYTHIPQEASEIQARAAKLPEIE